MSIRFVFFIGCALFLTGSFQPGFASTPAAARNMDATGRIVDLARADLMLRHPGARIEIQGALQWITGHLPTKASDISGVSVLAENSQGKAQIEVRGAVPSQALVSFAAWMPSYIALRRVAPGDRLNANDFVIQDVNIASGPAYDYRGVILSRKTSIAGLEARQTFLEGQFLTSTGVQRVPDIRRGDIVRIQVNSGALSLSTLGTAEEPGYIGESIRVMSKTKRELLGKLGPDGSVEVDL